MDIQKIDINLIKLNPNNPRIIKDEKFKKLVKSIKDFPEMLNIRPLVLNKDNVILGWNMRFRALKEAWIKEIPVIIAENFTEEQEKEFIIKDNVWFWEWDFEMLANEFDVSDLEDWGLDLNFWNTDEMSDDFSLPDWEKWEIEQIAFTLHKNQADIVREALNLSKTKWAFINTWNENSNWNALARIVETYLTQN